MTATTVLQLGAGPMNVHSIRILQERGIRVYAVDRNGQAPGLELADGGDAIDFIDAEGVTDYARQIGADVILPVNEVGVWTAAEASRRLGLPNIPVAVARRCTDKGLMRDAWAAVKLTQPAYRVVEAAALIGEAAAEIGFPVVVKPARGWGSRGVACVATSRDLEPVVELATACGDEKRFIVEAHVPGTELTVEGLVDAGRVHVLAISDKEHQPHERYRVAMALNYPAALSEAQEHHVRTLAERAVTSLALETGAFHVECMVNGTGVTVLEMGARPGGQHIFSHIVEAVCGICMPAALVALWSSQKPDLRPRHQRGACYKFFSPPHGVFKAIEGLDEARELPGVLDIGFHVREGETIGDISADNRRPGHVVSSGSDRLDAMANADRAIAVLEYVIEPAVEERIISSS